MNKGNICVSVCAETAEELIENIKRAAEFADVIELRFDCLRENDLDSALREISHIDFGKSLLATFRFKEQGGKREISRDKREAFWRNLSKQFDYADVEFNFNSEISNFIARKIVSFHDFSGVAGNLEDIYRKLSQNSEIIKIAIQTDDINDTIALWKLLEKAKHDKKQIIPIAMGQAGKWTRILGLANGAFMTYAALDSGKETADGQITAKDLIETYRVKELNENTDIYGIIGNPVAHSVSPFMHNAALKFHDLNAVYIPFEVKDLGEFIKRFIKKETREIELNFKGFSVTIPHKQAIIEYLDEIDETAKAIGAVNTVKIENGKLFGFNTDANGFIEPLKKAYGSLRKAKVAVIGIGGAARACVFALKKENVEVTIFARDLKKAESLAEEFEVEFTEMPIANRQSPIANFDIVVNATPLGTKGEHENETVLTSEQLKGVKLVYDLVYNPLQTCLMIEAKKTNVPKIGGIEMLVAQGAKQFEIWTGKTAPIEEMTAKALRKL